MFRWPLVTATFALILLNSATGHTQVYYLSDKSESITAVRSLFSSAEDIEVMREYFDKINSSAKATSKTKIFKDKTLQRFIELTPNQTKTLEKAFETYESKWNPEYKLVMQQIQTAEQNGESEHQISKLKNDADKKYQTYQYELEQRYNEVLLPFQKDLVSTYTAFTKLQENIPSDRKYCWPYLLSSAFEISDQCRAAMKQATFEEAQKIDQELEEQVDRLSKKILDSVPAKKRKAILEALELIGQYKSAIVPQATQRDLDELEKQFSNQRVNLNPVVQSQVAHDKKIHEFLQLSDAQVQEIQSVHEHHLKPSKEQSALLEDLGAAREKFGFDSKEAKALSDRCSEMQKKTYSDAASAIRDTLLPFQQDLFSTITDAQALRTLVPDKRQLYWPYLLATTQDLSNDELAAVKKATLDAKKEYAETIKKLTAEASESVLKRLPADKRKKMEQLLEIADEID